MASFRGEAVYVGGDWHVWLTSVELLLLCDLWTTSGDQAQN